MLRWAIIFLIVALIAGALGFSGVAAASISMAKIVFFIAIIAFVVSLLMHIFRR